MNYGLAEAGVAGNTAAAAPLPFQKACNPDTRRSSATAPALLTAAPAPLTFEYRADRPSAPLRSWNFERLKTPA